MATVQPDWISLGLGLLGGLALFLIGMDQMTNALKALAGHRLQRILSALSGNRVTGALTGAVSTAALQSSSVTTVLTVGFVSAELLTLTQAASVIVGANLGTTVTAQVIALNVSELSLGLLTVGAVLWLFVSNRTWRETALAERFAGHTDLDQYIVESGLREICARMTLTAQRLAIGRTS